MFLRGDYKTPIEDMQQTRQCRIYHLFLGVLKHRIPFSRGPIFLDFCLCGAILNLKAVCFGAIPYIMIELSSPCECDTNQAVMTVA